MRVRRPLAALCVIAPLALTASACFDSTAGNVTGSRGTTIVQVNNPVPDRCHRFGPVGVNRVVNNTGSDIQLYNGLNCSNPAGRASFYLAATNSTSAAAAQGLWRSFNTVGWPPPVPADVPTPRKVTILR